ncbi:MAG TPA: ribosomal-processing cysteine protease Prp [Erysipelotrichaceae bacterium]|nr:ribosomal-processing cysteine protease Prp [Erysipelotrichaceae bacterium]
MVKVRIVKKDGLIISLEISGHANGGQYGQDLVCAGVSCVAIGLANALDRLADECCTIAVTENLVSIRVLNSEKTIQTILQTGIIQFQTIEEKFPENIKIHITEV